MEESEGTWWTKESTPWKVRNLGSTCNLGQVAMLL